MKIPILILDEYDLVRQTDARQIENVAQVVTRLNSSVRQILYYADYAFFKKPTGNFFVVKDREFAINQEEIEKEELLKRLEKLNIARHL